MTHETKALSAKVIDHEPEQPESSLTLFGTSEPAEVMQQATKVANVLMDVVRAKGLVVGIGSGEHILVEAWCLLGAMCGVFPVVKWSKKVENAEGMEVGWEARVEAVTKRGEVVGAAEAMCLRNEKMWAKRDSYALRSMAQTRATSKALRGPLGFVVQLAGFSPTPAEEMPGGPGAAADPNEKPKGTGDVFKRIAGKLSGGSPSDFYDAKALFERHRWSPKTTAGYQKAMRAAAARLRLPMEPDFDDPDIGAAFDAGKPKNPDLEEAADEAARSIGR